MVPWRSLRFLMGTQGSLGLPRKASLRFKWVSYNSLRLLKVPRGIPFLKIIALLFNLVTYNKTWVRLVITVGFFFLFYFNSELGTPILRGLWIAKQSRADLKVDCCKLTRINVKRILLENQRKYAFLFFIAKDNIFWKWKIWNICRPK